jgi:hypothetical protein
MCASDKSKRIDSVRLYERISRQHALYAFALGCASFGLSGQRPSSKKPKKDATWASFLFALPAVVVVSALAQHARFFG